MSPASYLTAPPRVAVARIASVSVPWWTWIALAFFVLIVAAGGVIVLLTLLQMRRVRTTGVELGGALDELTRRTEELERRLERANERAELVERRMARLQGSMERLSVLTWALGDVGRTISQVRSAVTLRK
jgi:uncharacterized protein YoxC